LIESDYGLHRTAHATHAAHAAHTTSTAWSTTFFIVATGAQFISGNNIVNLEHKICSFSG
jgi:hypothetical protein